MGIFNKKTKTTRSEYVGDAGIQTVTTTTRGNRKKEKVTYSESPSVIVTKTNLKTGKSKQKLKTNKSMLNTGGSPLAKYGCSRK